MAGSVLPVNVDSTYADSGSDPSVKLHQQYHDSIHKVVNWFDKDAIPAGGNVLTWDAASGLYKPQAPAVGGTPWGVTFDSFSGASDELKMDSALTYMAAQTYPPALMFANRAHGPFATARTAFAGLRMQTGPALGDAELAGVSVPAILDITTSGVWMTTAVARLPNVSFRNMHFTGHTGVQWIGNTGAGSWLRQEIYGCGWSGFGSIIGSYATKLLCTACYWDVWDVANCRDTAVHVGGSDNWFWATGTLIDSGIAYHTGGVDGHPHVWLDSLEKSTLGDFYLTAEGVWPGVLVTGTTYTNGVVTKLNNGGTLTLPLSGATVTVDSTTPFAASGTFYMSGSAGLNTITYTGKTATTFTGCTGGTGTVPDRMTIQSVTPPGASGNLSGPIVIRGAKIEGRNVGLGCNGAPVRIEGGQVVLDSCWIGYGMINPAQFTTRSPVDNGLVHVEGGVALICDCTFDRAYGVTESVPVVHVGANGRARVRDITVGRKGGEWRDLPIVNETTAIAWPGLGATVCDDTVTKV
jgi:hypothetical protein